MNLIIGFDGLAEYSLASGETVFMLLPLNNRIEEKKIKTYEFDLYDTKK